MCVSLYVYSLLPFWDLCIQDYAIRACVEEGGKSGGQPVATARPFYLSVLPMHAHREN